MCQTPRGPSTLVPEVMRLSRNGIASSQVFLDSLEFVAYSVHVYGREKQCALGIPHGMASAPGFCARLFRSCQSEIDRGASFESSTSARRHRRHRDGRFTCRTCQSVFIRLLRKSVRRSALLSVLKYASVGLPSPDSLATPDKHALSKFHCIFDYTRKHTLIEYKGVTDDLEPADVLVLLGYACQYAVMNDISNLDDICLMFVAERMPPSVIERIWQLGGTFMPVGNGLWQGQLSGFSLHGVELRHASQAGSSERLLGLFTRAFVQDPQASRFTEGLDQNELDMYDRLCQHIRQLRRDPATMHSKDLDTAEKSLAGVLKRLIVNAPIEDRLEGLRPSEVFERYSPEERIAGLRPEERIAGLRPEERIAGLRPEERIAGLTPEQLAAALPPEVLEFLAQKAKQR